jgi:hypothetical protein
VKDVQNSYAATGLQMEKSREQMSEQKTQDDLKVIMVTPRQMDRGARDATSENMRAGARSDAT